MGTGNAYPERLRSALDTMLHGGEPRAQVRDDIWTSWRRSANSGLSPEQFTVPHTGDGDRDGLLVRAPPGTRLAHRRLGIYERRCAAHRPRRRHPRPMSSRAFARLAV